MKQENKQSKKRDSRYLLAGSLVIAFMLFIPYAFYLYRSVPDVKTFEIFGNTFTSTYYESVRYFMYNILAKIIPLSLLLVWFTTCKHWWYYSIAIPISVYIFQLGGVINDDVAFVDEFEFVYSLPISIIIILILFFLRSKISIFLKAKDIKKQMDEQMDKNIGRKIGS